MEILMSIGKMKRRKNPIYDGKNIVVRVSHLLLFLSVWN